MVDNLFVYCFALACNFGALVHLVSFALARHNTRNKLLIDKEAVGNVGSVLMILQVGLSDHTFLKLGELFLSSSFLKCSDIAISPSQ